MCKLLPRLGNDHKGPCLEKTCAVATDTEKNEHGHTCKRKFGPKVAQEAKRQTPHSLSWRSAVEGLACKWLEVLCDCLPLWQ